MYMVMFVILGAIAVASAVSVVAQRRVVYSALSLLLNLCALAGLYILLNAQFIAMVQIIVYAGAIVVLFLFGTMLLEEESEDFRAGKAVWLRVPGMILALVVLAEMVRVLAVGFLGGTPGPYTQDMIAQQGGVQVLGMAIYTDFLVPFELASVLLLAAIVGALFLARTRPEASPSTQPNVAAAGDTPVELSSAMGRAKTAPARGKK
jgi:NADH-quinone oxidoreductase subunit J